MSDIAAAASTAGERVDHDERRREDGGREQGREGEWKNRAGEGVGGAQDVPSEVQWEEDLEEVRYGIAVKGFQKVVALLGLQPGMTGPEVQEQVKKLTKASNLSALKHMKEGGGKFVEVVDYILDPTIFLSHCWQFSLQDIMESLASLDEDEIVWFDLLSVPQNQDPAKPPKPFTWWSTTFFKNVERIGKVVMVMKPITRPITLTRAWCVFELYACIATKSSFDVAMPAEVRLAFLELIRADHRSFFKTISSVDTRTCEAGHQQDLENIAKVITGAGGFGEIDQMVVERLKEWFYRVLEEQVEGASEEAERAAYRHSLGAMCREDGRYAEAEEHLATAWKERESVLGASHSDTLWSMSWLGQTKSYMHKHDESEELLADCLIKQIEVLGEDHERTLATYCSLGVEYGVYLERPEDGEELLQDALARAERVLGPEHNQTLIILNNLALTYATSRQHEQAEAMYLDCVQRCKKALGEGHPETLMTLYNLGLFYKEQGAIEEAAGIYSKCFKRQKEVLGANHEMTLMAMLGLGIVYEHQNKLEAAKQIFEDCLERMRATKHKEERICQNWLKMTVFKLCLSRVSAKDDTEEEGGSKGGTAAEEAEEEGAGEGK